MINKNKSLAKIKNNFYLLNNGFIIKNLLSILIRRYLDSFYQVIIPISFHLKFFYFDR